LRRESIRRLAARNQATNVVSRRSEMALAFFGYIFERTLKQEFHALRILRAGSLPQVATNRIIVYANHPSWWDGVLYVVLARRLFAKFKAFAPIDAKMLQQYAVLARLGAFGVAQNSSQGAADFIETSRAVLRDSGSMMFVAAQGRFADVRERPLQLSPGLAHLADLAPDVVFLPLAVETTFWIEKQPELLISFGQPISASSILDLAKPERLAFLEERLDDTMNGLRDGSICRDHSQFDTLIEGRSQINAIYDAWRRLRAFARGQDFRPGHGSGSA
jgi:1-acyl-sn-glycerol-3-phosphate acyltransferase